MSDRRHRPRGRRRAAALAAARQIRPGQAGPEDLHVHRHRRFDEPRRGPRRRGLGDDAPMAQCRAPGGVHGSGRRGDLHDRRRVLRQLRLAGPRRGGGDRDPATPRGAPLDARFRALPVVELASDQGTEQARPWPRIAVLGAGHSGPAIARAAVEAGYQVAIAASGDPERISLIAQVLVPGAEPRWAADAVADADVVILAIPIHKFAAFDPPLVAGKLVVDVMNYWPPVDGVQMMFEDGQRGSSDIVQERLAESTLVKRLNHLG